MGLLLAGQASPEKAKGPLRVHPDNPRYFTDGSGKAIYLTGSNEGWELQDNSWNVAINFDYKAYMDFLQAHNHNLIRLWVVEHTTTSEIKDPRAIASPMPYKRTGPGDALDDRPKFDLEQFDETYFKRLRSRVETAGDRGIYVIVMLFQGVSIWGQDFWFGHYLNVKNNINGVDGDLNSDGKGFEVHTLADSAITRRQRVYVRKVIDTVNDLDNVLYEIANEDCNGSVEWQYHFINYIKDYESTKAKQHAVGMTFRPRGTNEELFASPADWISPSRSALIPYNYLTNPPPADGSKLIISDTDHISPYTKDATWPWKSFLRGMNTQSLDGVRKDMSSQSPHEPIRQALGNTRKMAERMALARMVPRNDLASTKYCLANPGSEYVVYLPEGGEVTVNLSAASGKIAVEWIHPREGKSFLGDTVEGGIKQSFKAPFDGDAVLYLKANGNFQRD